DGVDALTAHGRREREARQSRFVVDQHGAGAAFAAVAAGFCSSEADDFPQIVQQQYVIGHRVDAAAAVENELENARHACGSHTPFGPPFNGGIARALASPRARPGMKRTHLMPMPRPRPEERRSAGKFTQPAQAWLRCDASRRTASCFEMPAIAAWLRALTPRPRPEERRAATRLEGRPHASRRPLRGLLSMRPYSRTGGRVPWPLAG